MRGGCVGLLLLVVACDEPEDSGGGSGDETTAGLALSSPDFADGDDLPADFGCSRDGGGDLSPSLTFSGVPAEATSLVVTMHYDPNPGGDGSPNQYWLLWGLAPELGGLEAGNPDSLGQEGSDKDGVSTGYTPPCSPSADETHTYVLTLHALSGDPGLPDEDDGSIDYEALTAAIAGATVEAASLTAVK